MKPYHKIQTVFKRESTKPRKLLMGKYSLPEFKYLKDNIWVFTEKVDGMNIRIMSYPEGTVRFGGKTDNAQLPAKLVERLIELFPVNGKLHEQFPDGVCLYGEGYGAGIQKSGGNYSSTQEFVLFDIRIGNWWLENHSINEVIVATNISEVVPIIGEGTLADAVKLVKGGFESAWGNFEAEGIVARPKVTLLQRNGERIITKLKCKDFKNV